MKKTKTITIKLTVEEVMALITEKYGGNENEETLISFDLKDVSDFDDRYPHYQVSGATVTVSKELK